MKAGPDVSRPRPDGWQPQAELNFPAARLACGRLAAVCACLVTASGHGIRSRRPVTASGEPGGRLAAVCASPAKGECAGCKNGGEEPSARPQDPLCCAFGVRSTQTRQALGVRHCALISGRKSRVNHETGDCMRLRQLAFVMIVCNANCQRDS